ncbi:RpiB/LacA/LacB family sugar-phosphate isomerase [Candidatus Woesearchaeota archaeon]|nr:RpiB/LacA/LacB family sugar-phosphate isomerase [Candidatus Woesearchaeota archaeon]MBW3005801.1 RpiB/LacA/LacB family sugar-phosphate isomerase [Candidatus Woesearchaeota archaeon]
MKIYLGSDHGGFKLKQHIKKYLKRLKYQVVDKGNTKYVMTDDYPDYGYKVAKAVQKAKDAKGIVFCGSAEGICIAANKVRGIHAVPVWTLENARLSRQHNNANVLCLSGWGLNPKKAEKIVKTWLETDFTFEPRHVRRLKKIASIEKHG